MTQTLQSGDDSGRAYIARVNWIVDSDLSDAQKMVLIVLARHDGPRGIFPSRATIARKASKSLATVKRTLKELADKGLIERDLRYEEDSRENTTSLYRVTLPLSQVGSQRAHVGSERTHLGSERAHRWGHSEPGVGSHRAPEVSDLNVGEEDREDTQPPTRDPVAQCTSITNRMVCPLMAPGDLGATPALKSERSKRTKSGSKRKPETPLPDGFEPSAAVFDMASKELGFDAARVRSELGKFKDHAAEKDRRARDWTAAFRRWLRKAKEFDLERAPAADTKRGPAYKSRPLSDEDDAARFAELKKANGERDARVAARLERVAAATGAGK